MDGFRGRMTHPCMVLFGRWFAFFVGSVCCLEEMDDHTGTYSGGPLKGQKNHPALASEWRQLRTSGQLEGIDEDILLWQQPNTWCTAELTCRLYNRFHGWAENRNVVIVQDMAAQQWCAEAKECAKALGQPLLPVARGMTMPLQLTDAEFAQQGKASEKKGHGNA